MSKYCLTCVLFLLGFHLSAQINFEISNIELSNHPSKGKKKNAIVHFDIQNNSDEIITEVIEFHLKIDSRPTIQKEFQLELNQNSTGHYELKLSEAFPEENFHLRIFAQSKDLKKRSNVLNRMVTFTDHIFHFTDINFGWDIASTEGQTNIMDGDYQDAPIEVYNFLTPNNDGKNDVLMIENLPSETRSILRIYSLDGEILFEQINYQNDWAGTLSSGEKVPQGQVIYSLEIDGVVAKRGYITIDY